ncbi:MAG: hypothetical protein WCP92_04230 [bacterium]
MENLFKKLFGHFYKEQVGHKEIILRDINVKVKSWDGLNQEKFIAIIKEIFSPVGIDIHLFVPHSSATTTKSDDKICIFIWSAPDSSQSIEPPANIWGIPVDCRDTAFGPTGSKTNIIYDGDYAVAEIVNGKHLYIFHDAVHKGTENEMNIFRMILEKSLAILSPDIMTEMNKKVALEEKFQREVLTNRMDKHYDIMKTYYIDICSHRLNKELKDLEKETQEGRNYIKTMQEDLIKKIRDIQNMEKRLIHLTSDKTDFLKDLGIEFDKLLQIPKVMNVITEAGGLVHVYTDTLYCTDPRTNLVHEIGKFKISVNTSGVKWENLTRQVDAYEDGQMAPHIWKEGNACLGNMEHIFPELIANYEYSVVIQLAIQFVESVNVDDSAGKHIDKWPLADTKLQTI